MVQLVYDKLKSSMIGSRHTPSDFDHQDKARARLRLSAPPDNATATLVDLVIPKAANLPARSLPSSAPCVRDMASTCASAML